MKKNQMILAKDHFYSLDCYETQLNNNVLVVGTSGAGKTRSIVIPNLLQATGSYIVSDPKGNLYTKYSSYLKKKGYVVKKLDFTDPKNSDHYNFFHYINSSQDIVKVAHMLLRQDNNAGRGIDPFWDEAAQLLLQAVMAYLMEARPESERTIENIFKLVERCQSKRDMDRAVNELDYIFEAYEEGHPHSYAVSTYNKFRVAADKTLRSILITLNTRLGRFDTPEIREMMGYNDFELASVGDRKTAVFVIASDTDRSLDSLVNVFFTQAMNELCRHADRDCKNSSLKVPVRFIMDDFATNCKINDFPKMIASIRSRNISTMLMIQAESQLEIGYGADAKTIIGNCDTYVYLGGNDVETARAVAERCDLQMKRILNMPVGTNWIFRRGQAPVQSSNFDLEEYLEESKLAI